MSGQVPDPASGWRDEADGMDYEFDLGTYSRPLGTQSREAQLWFDHGLLWLYGFNHEEAVYCFREAQRADPDCAMAFWGEAYAAGPFINLPWQWRSEAEARDSITTCFTATEAAMARREGATALERALIEALPARYPRNEVVSAQEFSAWDDAFAAAMREVHRRFPHDPDVVTLFAESLITRTPWQLWDRDSGEPADGADTVEAREVLEVAMRERSDGGQPPHAGMLHMYIHVMEMSPMPERALAAAEALHFFSPDNGHLNHMPCHIFLQCGRYADALALSRKAVSADDKYARRVGPFNFYTTARCHDLHAMMSAAMLLGDYRAAHEASQRIERIVTPELLRQDRPHLVATLENYRSETVHVRVRFGRWREIVAAPMPAHPELYVVTTLMHHYAKGDRPRGARRLRGGGAGTLELRCGLRRPAGRTALLQRHGVEGHGGRPGDALRRNGLSPGRPRGRPCPPPGGGAPQRPAGLQRALALDASAATRPRRPPPGTGAIGRGRSGLPGRPRPGRRGPALPAAPRQRVESARLPRVPPTHGPRPGGGGPGAGTWQGPLPEAIRRSPLPAVAGSG